MIISIVISIPSCLLIFGSFFGFVRLNMNLTVNNDTLKRLNGFTIKHPNKIKYSDYINYDNKTNIEFIGKITKDELIELQQIVNQDDELIKLNKKAKLANFFYVFNNENRKQTINEQSDKYYKIGKELLRNKLYEDAIIYFTKVINCNSTYKDFAYNDRAIARIELGEIKEAITDYSNAIELTPNFADFYYNRANAKFTLKDYNGAIADFTKAIELNPDDFYAYKQCANAKIVIGEKKGALRDLRTAIKIGEKKNQNLEQIYTIISSIENSN